MINSFGSNLYQEEVKHALSGKSIQTTLDFSLQHIAEQSFDADFSGALILMDPHNGALKALISRPSFDPMIFLEPLSYEQWHDLQQKKAFLNRAFNAMYPPASLFKLITISAALELGIIDENTTMHCKGYVRFAGRRYHCARRSGHGELSIPEAIAQSCNIPFYEIGKKISIDDLAHYAQRFGLGEKTHIMFNEEKGLVPTRQWKLETKGERWWLGETLSATIGQSYFLVTPIQVARMIASIFTGYLVTPRILEAESIQKTPLSLHAKTLKMLKRSLKSVVTQGTGAYVNKIEDLKIYAKTGTAQITSLIKRAHNEQYREHAWFIAHFKHKNNDPLVLVLIVEHAGTSRIATNIAKRFLTAYSTLMHTSENI
jgi:penicillin-binding protein 2